MKENTFESNALCPKPSSSQHLYEIPFVRVMVHGPEGHLDGLWAS